MSKKISTGAGIFESGKEDEYGVEYKGNRLLHCRNKELQGEYVVKEGTEVICNRAFMNRTSVNKISLPTSVLAIGESAFSGCKSLEHINIPEGIKELKKTTFSECENLKSLTLPSSIETVDNIAFDNKGLEELEFNSVPEFKKGAFYNCTNLKRMLVPKGSKEHFMAARKIFTRAEVIEKEN